MYQKYIENDKIWEYLTSINKKTYIRMATNQKIADWIQFLEKSLKLSECVSEQSNKKRLINHYI